MSPANSQGLSRKQRREQARNERKAREEVARQAAARRRRLGLVSGAIIALVAIAVAIVLATTGLGSKKTVSTSATANSGASSQVGLLTGPPPWEPQYKGLIERAANMHLPAASDVAYHVHAALHVYVEGKQIEVPSQIGLDQQENFVSPLHTHDSSGIIHMEAAYEYPFTLGEFFTVWGVKFSSRQIGGYTDRGNETVTVYVNGHEISDPASYQMKSHDLIAVDYGTPEEAVKEFPFRWAAAP